MRTTAATTAAVMLVMAAAGGAAAFPLWGSSGHEITAQIATSLLTPEALSEAQRILGPGDSIVNASTWADTVKYEKQWEWSKPLHFVNTPDWACDYTASDCPNNVCVVGAIQNYTQRLTTQTGAEQQYALKFLIHFCGDVHQPLHIGFASDYGGNEIHGSFLGYDTNLHHVWDTSVIYQRIDSTFNRDQGAYARFLTQAVQAGGNFSTAAAGWTQCSSASSPSWLCPDEWAGVSASLACTHAYTGPTGTRIADNFSLGTPYYEWAWPVVDQQLAKGGVRLAYVLNKVLGSLARERAAAADGATATA